MSEGVVEAKEEVVSKKLGSEADLKVEVLESGKVKLSIVVDSKGVDVELSAALDVHYFKEKLKAAIPGAVDDVMLDALEKLALALTVKK